MSRRRRPERFVFGLPLIAKAVAPDWDIANDLLGLTLRSLLAQGDAEFEVILAGHDRPPVWADLAAHDPRFRFLEADWEPATPTARNDDAGMKKWRIKEEVQAGGGGLLMYLDADDLIDRNLVSAARAGIGPSQIGAIVANGLILDYRSWRAAPLPDPRIFDGPFHAICGSSTIARIDPDASDPVRRDPHEALGSHHLWTDAADDLGLDLARLPVWGAYIVNSSLNHSETYAPQADWRRSLAAAIVRHGRPLSPSERARFGLPPA